jgi:hypothetical protein
MSAASVRTSGQRDNLEVFPVGARERRFRLVVFAAFLLKPEQKTVSRRVISLQSFQGARRWLRFHEKGGKEHEMPAHRKLGPEIASL